MPLLPRRRALALAGAGLLAASGARAAGPGDRTSLTPDQALDALTRGNARFIADPEICTSDLGSRRSAVAGHQAPWATVIACADSRVPPELLFGGIGLGELFVARNAGNLADTATIGTVEYGAAVLGSPLIVVLGHTRCGAVAAACDVVTAHATYPGAIGPMIEPIVPAAIAVRDQPGDFVDNTVRASALRTARRLGEASRLLREAVDAGSLRIVAAVYDLDSGKVAFLES
ncbi:MAG: carbonic anhydrase [Geminicoccaceae bacterium]